MSAFNRLLQIIWNNEKGKKDAALHKEYTEAVATLRKNFEEKYAPLTEKQKECLRQGFVDESVAQNAMPAQSSSLYMQAQAANQQIAAQQYLAQARSQFNQHNATQNVPAGQLYYSQSSGGSVLVSNGTNVAPTLVGTTTTSGVVLSSMGAGLATAQAYQSIRSILKALEERPMKDNFAEETVRYDRDGYFLLDDRVPMFSVSLLHLASFCLSNYRDVAGAVMVMEENGVQIT